MDMGHLHTLSILDQAKDATDPDENAAGVERVQTLLPQLVHLHALSCGHADQASVEDPGSYDKASKEENLHHQTTDDDILS